MSLFSPKGLDPSQRPATLNFPCLLLAVFKQSVIPNLIWNLPLLLLLFRNYHNIRVEDPESSSG